MRSARRSKSTNEPILTILADLLKLILYSYMYEISLNKDNHGGLLIDSVCYSGLKYYLNFYLK